MVTFNISILNTLPFRARQYYLLWNHPGCRFACPGLCAPLGFQPALAKSETSVFIVCHYKTLTLYLPTANLNEIRQPPDTEWTSVFFKQGNARL